mmetsp:Transcript_2747/g.5535  ORF Transcript_2747/g.5535 Transcript_2747/m.5535 type:complete len:205 (-) Transcript_2747:1086-1700(-)
MLSVVRVCLVIFSFNSRFFNTCSRRDFLADRPCDGGEKRRHDGVCFQQRQSNTLSDHNLEAVCHGPGLLQQALSAPSGEERHQHLQWLGDSHERRMRACVFQVAASLTLEAKKQHVGARRQLVARRSNAPTDLIGCAGRLPPLPPCHQKVLLALLQSMLHRHQYFHGPPPNCLHVAQLQAMHGSVPVQVLVSLLAQYAGPLHAG